MLGRARGKERVSPSPGRTGWALTTRTAIRHATLAPRPACDFFTKLARFIRVVLFHNPILFPVFDKIATNNNQTLQDTTGAIVPNVNGLIFTRDDGRPIKKE
jgi:hypothetical protein